MKYRLSLIIPYYNMENKTDNLINNLKKSKFYNEIHLIFINSSANDKSLKKFKSLPSEKYLVINKPDSISSQKDIKNLVMKHLRGDYTLYLRPNNEINIGKLDNILTYLKNSKADSKIDTSSLYYDNKKCCVKENVFIVENELDCVVQKFFAPDVPVATNSSNNIEALVFSKKTRKNINSYTYNSLSYKFFTNQDINENITPFKRSIGIIISSKEYDFDLIKAIEKNNPHYIIFIFSFSLNNNQINELKNYSSRIQIMTISNDIICPEYILLLSVSEDDINFASLFPTTKISFSDIYINEEFKYVKRGEVINNSVENFKYNVNKDIIVFIVHQLGVHGGVEQIIERLVNVAPNHDYYVISDGKLNNCTYSFPKPINELLYSESEDFCKSLLLSAYKIINFTSPDNKIIEHISPLKKVSIFAGDVASSIDRTYYSSMDELFRKKYIGEKMYFLGEANANMFKKHYDYVESYSLDLPYEFTKVRFNPLKNRKKFIIISRLSNIGKNSLEIIRIAKKLSATDIIVDVYGIGPLYDDIKKELDDMECENVVLKGYCENNILIKKIKDYKALLILSDSEGLPTVILESYNNYTPVISYDRFTAVNDIVLDQVTGNIVEFGNVNKFIEAMNCVDELYNDKLRYNIDKLVDKYDVKGHNNFLKLLGSEVEIHDSSNNTN